jgi:serine/threonine-protein kinase
MTDSPAAQPAPDASPESRTGTARPDDLLQTCRVCRHEFRAAARLVGKRIPCAHCGSLVDIANTAAAGQDALVGKKIGNCRLTYRLGSGGIGLVYAADQLSVGRRVAIKMLGAKAGANEVLVNRFQRESKLCAQINHPHVVHVYDCGFDRGVHFQVMELVDGGTLASLIEERGRLPWREATELALQLARALELMHGMDIIHRDIKPANVLIGRDAQGRRIAKLADLGLAKQLDGTDAGNGLTLEGKPLGSPSFMPPEQVRNAKDATARSDIYGIGATFYAALTGYRPFDGRTPYEVMSNVLTKEIVPPAVTVTDLPPVLNHLILRCLAKDPAQRPANATELAAELETVLALPTGPAVQPASAAWRRTRAVPAAGDVTPPTFTDRDGQAPRPATATWKRPTTEGAAPPAQAAPSPASPAPAWKRPPSAAAPAVPPPTAPAHGNRPLMIAAIALGVAAVALLLALLLRH